MDLYKQIRRATADVMSRDIDICNDPELNAALAFADKAHQRNGDMQYRKCLTYIPYIVHPVRVSNIVRIAGGSIAQQIAALLHDVVEDTPVSIKEVHHAFGLEVGVLVDGLTDVRLPGDGSNRITRVKENREHSSAQPAAGQTVKYADLIDNTSDISLHDPSFARSYLKEKALLLEGMDKGCPKLRAIAYRFLDEGMLIAMSHERRVR